MANTNKTKLALSLGTGKSDQNIQMKKAAPTATPKTTSKVVSATTPKTTTICYNPCNAY